ncbi:SDR family NAD(P)-dependent oxidoreductase [Cohnella fermenti]|uniref:SDR family oxidoreductase n=1 Tax=Cohnella fermenti TaxID=2565925 RepID=A0A4V3WE68_9BACL|nr:SDR family NAD(P)-dependent oxidoreductase [Cohnella fermenti]THF75004.1 SDR family oxidoreductase [Cohnella fermenti]
MKREEREMQGRTAIVTGAAGGIGKGIAQVLLREGCNVAVLDWDEQEGERTAQALAASVNDAGRVLFVQTNMSVEADIVGAFEQTAKRWSRVDILVNNVGTHYYHPIEQIKAEDWDRVMATDLRGYFLTVRQAVPIMRRQGRGAIVNIASVHANQTAPHCSAYAAVKGAVAAMGRSMALELAPEGIRVNTVLPGYTRNANIERQLAGLTEEERAASEREMSRNIPLGRLAEAVEIGDAVAFLAGDKASFITGASLTVDGGESSHLQWQRQQDQ